MEQYENIHNSSWADNNLIFKMFDEKHNYVGHVLDKTSLDALMNLLPNHGILSDASEDEASTAINSITKEINTI